MMIRIFLSHNSEDKPFVRMLASALESYGLTVWVDEGEIKFGESLIRKISEGLEEADFVLAILSQNSVESNWVKKELEIAVTREIMGEGAGVIPIVIDDCSIPTYLIEKRYADFRNKENIDKKIHDLFLSLIPNYEVEEALNTVRSAISAEFEAYRLLPKIDKGKLLVYFDESGPALKRITHLLQRHKLRGWTINNQDNPSTYEILSCTMKKYEGTRAVVETKEYFYLRWFSRYFKKYKVIYNQTNDQTYVLNKSSGENWKVVHNIYPAPKI